MIADPEEVRRLAALARLDLDEAEEAALRRDLDAILSHVAVLESVTATSVDVAVDEPRIGQPPRNDEIEPGLDPDEALASAPERDGAFFIVPRVLGP